MSLFKKKITAITHNGDFHSDDVFACAALLLWAEKTDNKIKIIRSREKEIIEKADMVVDVGGIFDPEKNRFDHHQRNGAGKRENGIPYASFGLVWKKYGEEICGDQEIADRIEKELVMPIDARDSGVTISVPNNDYNIYDYRIGNIISAFNLVPEENEKLLGEQFEKALQFAKEILLREMAWAGALINGERETLKAIKEQNEPEILILDKNMEWHEAVSQNKNIKFVIYPQKEEQEWCIQTGRNNLDNYIDRVKFPENWRGLRDEELVKASGIKEAVFCINGGWFAVAKTKEGAIEMANKALKIYN
ncbi:MAG: MYG1 family protein [Patescibacteria group bacterium]